MSTKTLDVRLDGFDHTVGKLHRTDTNSVIFNYTQEHLTNQKSVPLPISLALPLSNDQYLDYETRSFFGNLLLEQDGILEDIRAKNGLSNDDIVGLLEILGKDCAGSLSIISENAKPVKVPGILTNDYNELEQDRLVTILKSLYERQRLPVDMQDPSPLAGVQSKIALTILEDGRFAEPIPDTGAPTTHILKVPRKGNEKDPEYEALTLRLSRLCKIPTVDAKVHQLNGVKFLLVTRFDRSSDDGNNIHRIHQEDFAQALGLPSNLKYQRNGVENNRFDLHGINQLLDQTTTPALSRNIFIRAVLFDLLTGNADAHAKNHALLHFPDGRTELAPRYDLMPTRLDPNYTDELAFNIGEAETIEEINQVNLKLFLESLSISPKNGFRILRNHANDLGTILGNEIIQLESQGHKIFADLVAQNLRTLFAEIDGAEIPETAKHRDAFIQSVSGAWGMS